MLDNPNTTLYWCLRHGQRRQIAEEFKVWRSSDNQIGEVPVAALWLKRLSACGSIAPAMARARRLHHAELRRIEDSLHFSGAQRWRDELEAWRDHKYQLLALSDLPDNEPLVVTASEAADIERMAQAIGAPGGIMVIEDEDHAPASPA